MYLSLNHNHHSYIHYFRRLVPLICKMPQKKPSFKWPGERETLRLSCAIQPVPSLTMPAHLAHQPLTYSGEILRKTPYIQVKLSLKMWTCLQVCVLLFAGSEVACPPLGGVPPEGSCPVRHHFPIATAVRQATLSRGGKQGGTHSLLLLILWFALLHA